MSALVLLLLVILVGAIIVALGIALAPVIVPLLGWALASALALAAIGALLYPVSWALSWAVSPARRWQEAHPDARMRRARRLVINVVLWAVCLAALLAGADAWERWTCAPGYSHLPRCRAKYAGDPLYDPDTGLLTRHRDQGVGR